MKKSYFGRHSAKMFIKAKPVRFGFKLWCLASSDGYLYQFMPYGGKNDMILLDTELGLGGSVVQYLLSFIAHPKNHRIYFDNFFTSYKLLVSLREKEFRATGTIRDNRTVKCPLESVKSLAKKPRGAYDVKYDHKNFITVCRWNDNAVVTIATNFEQTETVTYAKRYNRKEKKEVHIPQPNLISTYNKCMGGVDLHDNGIANYRITIGGKKWWWPLFINVIDSTIVNSWKLHRIIYKKESISLLDFKSYLVRTMIKEEDSKEATQQGVTNLVLQGRPSTSSLPVEVIHDNIGHVITKNIDNRRRRCRLCKSTTIYFCCKCKIPLHPKCFSNFHKK